MPALFSDPGSGAGLARNRLTSRPGVGFDTMTAMVFAPGSLCACSCLVFVYVLYRSLPDIYGTGSKLSLLNNPSGFAPVVRVMFGWISLYFTFLFYQSWTKFYALIQLKREARLSEDKPPSFADVKYRMAAGNKFFALNGDRTVGNMLEQSFPFLVSLWLHAFYADVGSAAQLGWIWLLFRAIYPAVFSKGIPFLLLSTVPGYTVLVLLCYPVWNQVL